MIRKLSLHFMNIKWFLHLIMVLVSNNDFLCVAGCCVICNCNIFIIIIFILHCLYQGWPTFWSESATERKVKAAGAAPRKYIYYY